MNRMKPWQPTYRIPGIPQKPSTFQQVPSETEVVHTAESKRQLGYQASQEHTMEATISEYNPLALYCLFYDCHINDIDSTWKH